MTREKRGQHKEDKGKFKTSTTKKSAIAKLQLKDTNGEIRKETMFYNVLSQLIDITTPKT